MKQNIPYEEARDLLIGLTREPGRETVPLEESCGRILAQQLAARENVPAFDRSPYDGYAFRAADSRGASAEHPVTLRILEEVPAGSVPTKTVTEGTAVKILTGAPIPPGADAVTMYEKTRFSAQSVSLLQEYSAGDNIIRAGEDVRKGQILAEEGCEIDPGLAGTLASQGTACPEVFRKPLAGIISTGSELVDVREEVPAGRIRNSNRYTLAAALLRDGCVPRYLGTAGDSVEEIAALIREGLKECDLILLTGGVSAGDYDLTPAAMQAAGCELLVRGVGLKPGMACCYGVCGGRLVCGLSGNPSSSLTNYYAVLRPAIRKMAGRRPYMPEEITVTLKDAFRKKTKGTRLLKGICRIEDGRAVMYFPQEQGNVMISSSIGCNVMAVIPAGSGALEAGAQLKGFMI